MDRRLFGGGRQTYVVLALLLLFGCIALESASRAAGRSATSPPVQDSAPPRTPLLADKLALVSFQNSPFPWRGFLPGTRKPFLFWQNGKRRTHTNESGGYYWEDPTFMDRRSLLYIPKGFDIRQPALIVVYFHGQRAELMRDVRDRQQVPRQLAESGLNAVLLAPQFAVDAFDSSAGRFWEKDAFAKYLDEAGGHLAALHGGHDARSRFATAPVVLVAYSGGYQPAAYAADLGGADERLAGVILLDAPYGEEDMLVSWLSRRHADSFFLSAYAMPPRDNNALLQRQLTELGATIHRRLPMVLTPGTIVFFDAGDHVGHEDFVTQAWVTDPLKRLLGLIPGFTRSAP